MNRNLFPRNGEHVVAEGRSPAQNAAHKAWETRRRRGLPQAELPPHSPEAEAGALACVLSAAETGEQSESDALLAQLRPRLFYLEQNRTICEALTLMRMHEHAITTSLLVSWLKDKKLLESAGGIEYVARLPEQTPSVFNFPAFREVLADKANRRLLLAKMEQAKSLASDVQTCDASVLQAFSSDLFDATHKGSATRARVKIWTAKELEAYQPPEKLKLVGDHEINMGYEGITVIAGPGSSGKSLCAMSLALAGAIGSGNWMGRKVHRQFKTLIIQAENGSTRLKHELSLLKRNHPRVDIDGHIFVSDPPEGGLPFHNSEFRSELRRVIQKLKPDLITLDPWSHVATEDAAKDVVDKLAEIRTTFPAGDECPGLLIVAHTNKPRTDVVRTGRGLTYLVSGSVALPNTARCVYVLLPWSDDPEDERVYWTCAKLNNGQMYAPSVWQRRIGTFFTHDEETDPRTWGNTDEDKERRAVTPEMLKAVFAKLKKQTATKTEIARQMAKQFEVGKSTVYRALDTYLTDHTVELDGEISLKKSS